jgi:glycosyltransferase involved in cell wall biosynthesis
MSRIIALTPVFNEELVIQDVLERIYKHVDMIIVVDDCSKDSTADKIKAWKQDKPNVYCISLAHNVGASGALKMGYVLITRFLKEEILFQDDLIVEIDSDGQHDPKYIPQLRQPFLDGDNIDVVLARRDFTVYPRYKRFGNRALTLIANMLSGFSYHDVESNFRVTRARVFPQLLEYFSGYRYSGAFEIGIILASLKYHIMNDIVIEVPFYRAGARAVDGLYVLAMGLYAWAKVRLGLKNRDVERQEREALDALNTTEDKWGKG